MKNKKLKLKVEKTCFICVILVVVTGFFLLNLSLPCFSQQEPLNQTETANKALEERRFKDAIEIYSSILQEEPDNLAAQARLARCYYLAANENSDYLYQAAEEYSKLVQKVPDFSLPYLELGQIAYILGLTLETEDKQKHAQGLYESALDWLSKYIQLEQKSKTFESQREVVTTKVLQAIVYNRMKEKDTALRLITEAKEEHKIISSQKLDLVPLYDYFVRSAVEYITAKSYNQALIYLEGAWLIQPRPQVKSLFENVIKAKKMPISLSEPLQKEEVGPQEVIEKKIEELIHQLENTNKKLELLPSLEEKIEVLKEKVINLLELEGKIEKLKTQLDSLSQQESGKLNQKTLEPEDYSSPIAQLSEKIDILYKHTESIPELKKGIEDLQTSMEDVSQLKIDVQKLQNSLQSFSKLNQDVKELKQKLNGLDKRINDIKSIADKYGILTIQLQELKKTVEEIKEKMIQPGENEVKKESGE